MMHGGRWRGWGTKTRRLENNGGSFGRRNMEMRMSMEGVLWIGTRWAVDDGGVGGLKMEMRLFMEGVLGTQNGETVADVARLVG